MTIQELVTSSKLYQLETLLEIAKTNGNEEEIKKAQEAYEAYEELCIKLGKIDRI